MVFLKDCVDRLCHRLHQDYKIYVADYLVFDVVGEITCARSFDMIENGEDHT